MEEHYKRLFDESLEKDKKIETYLKKYNKPETSYRINVFVDGVSHEEISTNWMIEDAERNYL